MAGNNGTGISCPPALKRALRQAKSFGIVGHVKPDADTAGSSLAIASLIRRLNPRRRIVLANANPVPEHLRFLPHWQSVVAPASRSDLKGLDCAIYLECANPERAGPIAVKEDFRLTINIDHHKTGKDFADINWVNPAASSNAEQVYTLFQHFKVTPSRNEATWLYAGMVSDTGRFQYSLTKPSTHRVAAKLLETGIAHTHIVECLFTRKSEEHLRLLARALTSLQYFFSGQVAVMKLTERDFNEIDFQATHTEDIVNYGLAPEHAEVSLFFKEEPFRGRGVMSVSLRSRGHVDVSSIAAAFGGGGHHNAAGCEIKGMSLEEAHKAILDKTGSLLPSH